MSESERALIEEVEGGVATLTLNRPKALNALSPELMQELFLAAARLGSDPAVRAVLIRGEGRGFCAGGDVKSMMSGMMGGGEGPPAVMAKRGAGLLHSIIAELRRMPKPVICAVHGPCAGAGVGLALAGDIIWAAESARFRLAYTGIGLCPDGGTTYALPRAVGEKMALELFLTNRELDAKEALRLGLVSQVFPDEELGLRSAELAGRLSRGPTKAYAAAKALVRDSLREGLETQMESETQAVAAMMTTADFLEGVSAFVQKRDPEFKGE